MEVTKVELSNETLDISNSQSAVYTQIYRVELEGYNYIEGFKENVFASFFVLSSGLLPQDYDPLTFSEEIPVNYDKSVFRCTSRNAKITESGDSGKDSLFSVWAVTIIWTANVGIVIGAVTQATRLVSIDRGFQPYDFVETKSYRSIDIFGDDIDDVQGKPTFPIQNSAGDPPSEGLVTSRNISWLRMELEYKEEYFDPKWLTTAFNTVNLNATTVCDYPIGEANGKLTLEDAQMIVSGNGQVYWVVKLLLEIKEESWITEWVDAGFNVLDDNDKSTPILQKDINDTTTGDAGNEKVGDAQKLNGKGKLNPTDDDPVFQEDLMTFPQDWTILDLPTSLKGE